MSAWRGLSWPWCSSNGPHHRGSHYSHPSGMNHGCTPSGLCSFELELWSELVVVEVSLELGRRLRGAQGGYHCSCGECRQGLDCQHPLDLQASGHLGVWGAEALALTMLPELDSGIDTMIQMGIAPDWFEGSVRGVIHTTPSFLETWHTSMLYSRFTILI